MRNLLLSLMALLAFSVSARGQFYTAGTDPGYLRWYSVESPYYKIIYPEGADSLARTYARLLEQFRVPVSRSIDHLPKSGKWGKRMPVVLHTHNLYSNGSVGYAPVRMDFFTMPEASGSEPVPWPVQLAAHEPRHQTLITGKLSCFFAESRPVPGITAMRNKIRSMHIFTPSGYILYYLIFFSYNRH